MSKNNPDKISFRRGLLVLLSGSVASRLISLLAAPLLTRIYSPIDFGILALFTAFVTIVLSISTLRYNQAIPITRSFNVAVVLALISLSASVLGSLVFWIIAISLHEVEIFHRVIGPVVPYLPLIVAAIILATLYEAIFTTALRLGLHSDIARMQFNRAVSSAVVKILIGIVGLKPWGLLLGQMVQTTGGFTIFRAHMLRNFREATRTISLRRVTAISWKFRNFPLHVMPSTLALTLAVQMPPIVFSAHFGASEMGLFAFSTLVMVGPVNLITQSVGAAYLAEASMLVRQRNPGLSDLTRGILINSTLIVALPAVGLYLYGRPIFGIAFGTAWEISGQYASDMAPFIALQVITAPLMQLLVVIERTGALLLLNTLRVLILIGLFIVIYSYNLEMDDAVKLYSTLMAVFYVMVMATNIRIIISLDSFVKGHKKRN